MILRFILNFCLLIVALLVLLILLLQIYEICFVFWCVNFTHFYCRYSMKFSEISIIAIPICPLIVCFFTWRKELLCIFTKMFLILNLVSKVLSLIFIYPRIFFKFLLDLLTLLLRLDIWSISSIKIWIIFHEIFFIIHPLSILIFRSLRILILLHKFI